MLGAGIEDPAHGDFVNSVAITAAMKGTTEIYGYVDIGISDSFSIAAIQTKVNNWKTNGHADGIF